MGDAREATGSRLYINPALAVAASGSKPADGKCLVLLQICFSNKKIFFFKKANLAKYIQNKEECETLIRLLTANCGDGDISHLPLGFWVPGTAARSTSSTSDAAGSRRLAGTWAH